MIRDHKKTIGAWMKKITNHFHSLLINLDRKGLLFPIALLLICVAAYGVLVTKLGYHFDDWPFILMTKSDINIWNFFKLTRPFSAWTYVLPLPLLGINPTNWHLYILVLRWLTGLGAYWTLIQLWPLKKREILFIVFLFTVYPAFWQQSISVAYSQHFTTYLMFFISMGSMLAALRRKNSILLWGISLLTAGAHLLTMEYFWGLELLRPVFIWIFLAQTEPEVKKRIIKTVQIWLPFLAIFMGALIYRFFIINLAEDPNPVTIFNLFSSNQLNNLLDLSQKIIRDLSYILITGWYTTFQIDLIDRLVPFQIAAWVLVACAGLVSYIFFRNTKTTPDQSDNSSWPKQALLLGFLIIIVGTIPGWAVNRFITVGRYSDRIALPALFGASIILVTILTRLVSSYKKQILLVGILVGLATGAQFRMENDFKWDWIMQQRVYWQLYWRAPMVMENTVFMTDGGLFKYTGDYPTALALNVLYSQRTNSFEQPYWIWELDDAYSHGGKLLPDTRIEDGNLNISYSGLAKDNLVFDFVNDGSCLKVYTELDADNLVMPELFRRAAPLFNSSRIIPESPFVPDPAVFGKEPPHTWCYYFEKAELARQQGHWQTIADLGDQSLKKGYKANNIVEWLPFIDGYVHVGDLEQAQAINSWILARGKKFLPQLCAAWEEQAGLYPQDSEKSLQVSQIWQSLSCPSELP